MKQKYELKINDEIAYADYHIEGDTLFIDYVFAPPALRGTGAAGKVMESMINMASEKSLKAIPICAYAAAWMKKKSL